MGFGDNIEWHETNLEGLLALDSGMLEDSLDTKSLEVILDTFKESEKGVLTLPDNSIGRELVSIEGKKVLLTYNNLTKIVCGYIISGNATAPEFKECILPKEANAIKDVETFLAYTRNVYVKSSTFSDGEVKLYITPKGLGGMQDLATGIIYGIYKFKLWLPSPSPSPSPSPVAPPPIAIPSPATPDSDESESITPTTWSPQMIIGSNYNQVDYNGDFSLLNDANLYKATCIADIGSIPLNALFQEVYSHNFAPSVTRFGIHGGVFGSTFTAANSQTHGILHPAEYSALYHAVQHLSNTPPVNTASPVYKGNVALVDFFERKQQNPADQTQKPIKLKQGTNYPATHCIVLWKTSDYDITIIDPNDRKHSGFISETHRRIDNYTISSLDARYSEKLYLAHNTPLGRGITDARDCIDIAVKIALEINELQLQSSDKDTILREIFRKMSTYFVQHGSELPKLKVHREAHSSDSKEREEFDRVYTKIESLRTTLSDSIRREIFKSPVFR